MYADDLLIFLKADQRNRDTVIDAIDKYCKWSGQMINVSKSKLFFSKNCSARCREDFLQGLGFDEMSGEEKFLGNLIIFNGRRSSDFDFVIDKICSRNAGFLSTSLPYRASPLARGIWATRDFITDNSVWIGGQNSSIYFWCQQWLCGDGPILQKGIINPLIKNLNLVSDLVDIDSSGWNVRMVEDVFVPDAASMIISSDRNVFPVVDIACWKSSKDGSFSLKASYWDYNKSRFAEKDNLCEKIWLAKIHERFNVFLWKLCQDALPFSSKLQSIFGKPPGSCYLCGCEEKDTAEHFISGCSITRRLWFSSRWGLRPDALSSLNGRDLVAWLLHPPFSIFSIHRSFIFLQKNIETCFSEHEKVRTVENERPDSGLGVVDYRWGLPRPGRVRGFVDFASDREMGAMAVVLFDASGSVMAFGAKKVVVHDVFQGELEALLFGVTLALDMQIERVDFHSDNSMLF
ncbi:hypothetical protein G4B88_027611 [Cannabis sativa]|uniref:Reverse transcriptase domain-containing protein n=1 Tax=Cannabis sativa TaxID=3483 RepID=A0A7J6HR39_CANSA|nr:hypothetical protein G4B88_027611 [Cannabis sativa]